MTFVFAPQTDASTQSSDPLQTGGCALARSNVDWHRLLQLCAFTDTLVIDADGCYSPADFNDGLLLGLKGTMAQAELHFLRARLQGGKLNKAKRGELRVPLPVGLCYDGRGQVVLDSDEEVRGAVALIFRLFQETGSAHAVMQWFVAHQCWRRPRIDPLMKVVPISK